MRYIYLLKDPITKDVVYIGETSDPKVRYDQHRWGVSGDSEEKKKWLTGLKSIGLIPLFEIVDSAETKRQALIKENELIVWYLKQGRRLFNQNNVTTIKQYDRNGKLINEFANATVAQSITGLRARVDRHSSGGYHWSYGDFNPEAFQAPEIAKAVLRKPVIQMSKSGDHIAEYVGVREAWRKTGIDHRSIAQVASGNSVRKSAGGFIWKYKVGEK